MHLATAVTQTGKFLCRQFFFLILNTQHTLVGMHLSQMVIVEISRALSHLHCQHIECQQIKLITGQTSGFFYKNIRFGKTHLLILHKSKIFQSITFLLSTLSILLRH